MQSNQAAPSTPSHRPAQAGRLADGGEPPPESSPVESESPISPYLGLALGVTTASTAAIVIRYAQADAPSLSIAAWRLTLATLILLPLILARHREEISRLERPELVRAALSGVFLAIHFATWISSLEYTSVAASAVLVSTSPLFVGLLSPLVLGERVGRKMVLGMLIAIGGSSIVGLNAFGSGTAPLLGDALALAGAICAAGYMLIGRTLRPRLSLLTYIFVVYGMAAIVLLLIALLNRQPLLGFEPRVYGWFLYLALGPQLIGHSSLNWALRYLSAAYVTVAMLSEPVGSSLLAFLLLREAPTAYEIVGGVLILGGIALASRAERT